MPKLHIRVDVSRSVTNQPFPIHNRWHPAIPAVAEAEAGDTIRVECVDFTGCQISDSDSAGDILHVDLTQLHYLSGPIAIKGSEPGDLLVVDILDVGALEDSQWGFSGIFDKTNGGGGFLSDQCPNAAKAIWKFEGNFATSRHIPGVKIPGALSVAIMGCAPSPQLLHKWTERASAVAIDLDASVVYAPSSKGALLGAVTPAGSDWTKIASEGASTVSRHKHGGACESKNLVKGSRVYLPVHISGSNLSVGNINFSQGEAKFSLCGGIAMAGWVDLKVDCVKGGMKLYKTVTPIFCPAVETMCKSYMIFEGTSVDLLAAYRQACVNLVQYLMQFGYTAEQAYMLLSAAPCESRINDPTDLSNCCYSISLPTTIFEFDIRPSKNGPKIVVPAAPAVK